MMNHSDSRRKPEVCRLAQAEMDELLGFFEAGQCSDLNVTVAAA